MKTAIEQSQDIKEKIQQDTIALVERKIETAATKEEILAIVRGMRNGTNR